MHSQTTLKVFIIHCGNEIYVEVNGEQTKYFVISREQCARQYHDLKTSNSSSKIVTKFKYLSKILTNKTWTHE